MCVHVYACLHAGPRSNSTKVMGRVLGLQASAIMPVHLEVAVHTASNAEPHSTSLIGMAVDSLPSAPGSAGTP